ncbi:MAG: glycerophosphodiester phosphodiesterase family protein [bacterium]
MRAAPVLLFGGLLFGGLLLAGCGGSSPAQDAALTDGQAPDAAAPVDAAVVDAAVSDGGPTVDSALGDGGVVLPDGGTYRNSLSVCWTDVTCQRAMSIGHGGAWSIGSIAYNSNAAISNAYAIGMEGVKIDVRVSSDDIPVVSHSSPIEIYESWDCGLLSLRIEEETAARITQCHRETSTTERFQRLDDVLNYLRGKMVVQLCVKRSEDYQRTIDEIHALGAEDFAFIELGSAAELQTIIPTLLGADTVWYLVNVASNVADVDTLIDVIQNPRAFMYEFDPGVDVSTLTPNRLHPAGVRSFTYDSAIPISVQTIQGYFEQGYDVVSAQDGPNNVQARITVNTARSITPP